MKTTSKVLISIAILSYGMAPLFADLNPTHLVHPEWPPHARLHMAWLLAANSSIALLAGYLVWLKDEVQLGGVMSVCVLGGFWIAAATRSLYGGAFADVDGIDMKILGFDANAFLFSLTLLAGVVGMVLHRFSKPT